MESGEEDSKLIGVYSTRQLADTARGRSRLLSGFRDEPEGFIIDDYELDKDHWTDGYVTVYPEQSK